MNIAETLKNARAKANLTQKKVSLLYDIPLRTLESWETGERVPPEYVVNLLLRCLEVDFQKVPLQKKVIYTYCDERCKPLPARIAELLKIEFEQGRFMEVPVEDAEGDMLKGMGKLFICTEPSTEIGLGVTFRVIPREE